MCVCVGRWGDFDIKRWFCYVVLICVTISCTWLMRGLVYKINKQFQCKSRQNSCFWAVNKKTYNVAEDEFCEFKLCKLMEMVWILKCSCSSLSTMLESAKPSPTFLCFTWNFSAEIFMFWIFTWNEHKTFETMYQWCKGSLQLGCCCGWYTFNCSLYAV